MKKIHLLGHIFEATENAYNFIESYVKRIEEYANQNDITKDIVEDIKYSIIEKLYRHETPIQEAQAIAIANSIGEPESIFDEMQQNTTLRKVKNRLGKSRPIFWWVCYRIATSLNVSVRIVRIIALITILFWFWPFIYAILALFAPYKDHKKTTGKIWSVVYEIIRIALWLLLLAILLPITIAILLSLSILLFTPSYDNQSITQLISPYMYRLIGAIALALLLLCIGAIWWLCKQKRISKTLALLSTIVIIWGWIAVWWLTYQKAIQIFENTNTSSQTITLSSTQFSGNKVSLDIDLSKGNNSLLPSLALTHTTIVPTSWKEIILTIENTLRWSNDQQLQEVMQAYQPLAVTGSNNAISIKSSDKTFTKEVPFAFVQRHITISMPSDKEIILNRADWFREWLTRSTILYDNGKESWQITCADRTYYIYSAERNGFVCKNWTKMGIY
jgi:phage shock protein PspC (stress-responsive transcriptional regulator)